MWNPCSYIACRGESTLKKYLLYRGWESSYSCLGISICSSLWTWINSCWFRIHEERWQHISASQQGLSLVRLHALFCLCLPAWQMKALIHADAIEACWCVSVQFHFHKSSGGQICSHSWSGVWRENGSVQSKKWLFFVVFFFWKKKILRRIDSIVTQSPNSKDIWPEAELHYSRFFFCFILSECFLVKSLIALSHSLNGLLVVFSVLADFHICSFVRKVPKTFIPVS